MRRFTLTFLAAAVLSLCHLAHNVRAQTGPIGGSQPAPQSTANQQLTETNIPSMLQTAGFQVEEKTDAFAKKFWVAKIQQNGWGYVIELSPYQTQQGQITGFWLKSPLGSPIDPAKVNTNSLLNLLALNHLQAPYFFSYNNSRIYLNWEYPYTQISQHTMRTELDRFMKKVQDTSTSWLNLNQAATPATGSSK